MNPYRTFLYTPPLHTETPRWRPHSAARSIALQRFAQAVRAARLYEALASKMWQGEDDKPKPHILVRMIGAGTVGLASSSMAAVWWHVAWQFAEIRWLTEDS